MSSRVLFGAVWLLCWPGGPALAGAIHDAAKKGDVGTIARLLDEGADVNEPDAVGETPLTAAALAGHPESTTLLIKRGANIRARNNRGISPLHAAVYGGDIDVVKLLVGNGAAVDESDNRFKVTPLHLAAEENYTVIVGYLLRQGADIDARDVAGYTPLSLTIFKRNKESAVLLIGQGATCQTETVMGPKWFAECKEFKK